MRVRVRVREMAAVLGRVCKGLGARYLSLLSRLGLGLGLRLRVRVEG